ncbi:endonuclease domain-containing 1 protein-like [Xyrauchen texanus]|uniref:endonuclease domain-containing 1 protein-like n=1 Tax=Xyrauchen texanus TaxID=154827 RepID=UPI00224295C8|nr:endonuclease domain-containing 1 protein-like [Xyrauchen texanus]
MMLLLPALMLSLLSGVSARVVRDFQNTCDIFFAEKQPPTVFSEDQYKKICQTLNGIVYYATLYDTENKIPVYSAYTYEGKKNCERRNYWYIEPQLDDNNAEEDMGKDNKKKLSTQQAVNEDYDIAVKIGFHRGHLAPVSQANSQSCVFATFTLTNAAPQYRSFNQGKWRVVEGNLVSTLESNCQRNTAYIVTGVVPGNDSKLNNRVNVPSHFWTTYCCKTKNNYLISGGVIGENVNSSSTILRMSVKDLEIRLSELYRKGFSLFSANCREAKYVEVVHYGLARRRVRERNRGECGHLKQREARPRRVGEHLTPRRVFSEQQ